MFCLEHDLYREAEINKTSTPFDNIVLESFVVLEAEFRRTEYTLRLRGSYGKFIIVFKAN